MHVGQIWLRDRKGLHARWTIPVETLGREYTASGPLGDAALVKRLLRNGHKDPTTMDRPSLTSFKALSFDCYGTLINWEDAIFKQLSPLLERLPQQHPFRGQTTVITRFGEHQTALERENPGMRYRDVLATCYERIASQADLTVSETEARDFASTVGKWEAFPDTVAALRQLKKHYKLVILSNVGNVDVRDTIASQLGGIDFDAVLTAEDIGSYKPNHANFRTLLTTIREKLGLEQGDLLHVAKSLPVDHVPAKELGITSAWIARGNDGASSMGGHLGNFEGRVAFKWRFASLGEMASEVEHESASKV